tara:strand:+ start:49 stop:606 length:558 start_codon:yes stop_codon:yes gene_type:complete
MTKLYLWNDEEKWNDELNEAWANLGEHGFVKEATYVSRKDDFGDHYLITVERRDGWDGMEPHFRVGYYNAAHESATKYAGQWLIDEAETDIDWDWTFNYSKHYELEYKTWDDLLNDNGFRPLDEWQMNTEAKSIKEKGMTRYELCWDRLHEWMCQQQKMGLILSPPTVLEMMSQIEDEILGPQEE